MRRIILFFAVALLLPVSAANAQRATTPVIKNELGKNVGATGVLTVDSQGDDATDPATNSIRFNCVAGCSGGGGGSTGGTATAASPTYTEGATGQALSVDLSGRLRTLASQNGTWTVGLNGTLPAFAATPTVNVGTLPALAAGESMVGKVGTYSGSITISSLGTGTGGAGTYNTSVGSTIASTTVTAYNQVIGSPNRDFTDTGTNIRWTYNDDLVKTRLGGGVDFAVPTYLGLSADPTPGNRDRIKVHPWSSVTAAADAGSGATLIVVGTCPPLGSAVNLGGQARTILTATYDGTNCTLTGTNTTGISGTWGTRTAGAAVNAQYFADGQSTVAGLHPALDGYQLIAPYWAGFKAWRQR